MGDNLWDSFDKEKKLLKSVFYFKLSNRSRVTCVESLPNGLVTNYYQCCQGVYLSGYRNRYETNR